MSYYIRTKSGHKGPFDSYQLQDLVAAGKLTLEHHILDEDGKDVKVGDAIGGKAAAEMVNWESDSNADAAESQLASRRHVRSPEGLGASPSGGSRKVGLWIIVIALGVGIYFWQRTADSGNVEDEAKELVAQFPGYDANKEYYDSLVEIYHADAFSAASTQGQEGTSFDETKYMTSLISKMAAQAGREKRRDIKRLLTVKLTAMQAEERKKSRPGAQR